MASTSRFAVLGLVAFTLTACAPARSTPDTGASTEGQPTQAQPRTLVVMTRVEPRSLLSKGILTGVFADGPNARRVFNAALFIEDERDVPIPYLVEEAPRLDTDSWKLFPDGRMETTYRLRPNLTWHDGAALTAEDFVFALKIFTDPALAGNFTPTPQNLMDEALAPIRARSSSDGSAPRPTRTPSRSIGSGRSHAIFWKRRTSATPRTRSAPAPIGRGISSGPVLSRSIDGKPGPRSRAAPSTGMPWVVLGSTECACCS